MKGLRDVAICLVDLEFERLTFITSGQRALMGLFDPSGVDPPVGNELLQRQPRLRPQRADALADAARERVGDTSAGHAAR